MSENYTATYSPEDNKLRLYAVSRLPRDLYDQAKAAGFKWAPKQELFVAPMWTPGREDFLLTLVDEIEDEDKSLVERAEERADRFEDYSDNRAQDAERARSAVAAIADNIPFGQPILVGHHSERHARRDAKRIENGMRRAVNMWKQSEYWTDRAAGAIHHAKYKELPAVRARRIKGLEADKRKQERSLAEHERCLLFWNGKLKRKEEVGGGFIEVNWKTARWFTNIYDHTSACYSLADYPRKPGASTYEGSIGFWSALGDTEETGIITPEQARDIALRHHMRWGQHAERWIEHYSNRLAYERAMLSEAGGIVTDRKGPEKGGAVKCWASPGYGQGWSYIHKVNKVSVSVLDNWGNPADLEGGRNFSRTIPFDKLKEVMTAAEVRSARDAGELNELPSKIGFYLNQTVETRDEASARVHREAVAAAGSSCDCKDCQADAKIDDAVAPLKAEPQAEKLEASDFEAMQASLKAGVQVVTAPQLFPTPPELAARMVSEAGIESGDAVLEPSAGSGNILAAIRAAGFNGDIHLDAIEINQGLCKVLRQRGIEVDCHDFLEVEKPYCPDAPNGWDRIIMNPPFINGADIKHIEHAIGFLKPGGRLVALCANGPRQRAVLEPLADYWEDSPAGSFSEQGTNVNVVLLVINAPEEKPVRTTLFD